MENIGMRRRYLYGMRVIFLIQSWIATTMYV